MMKEQIDGLWRLASKAFDSGDYEGSKLIRAAIEQCERVALLDEALRLVEWGHPETNEDYQYCAACEAYRIRFVERLPGAHEENCIVGRALGR